MSVYICDDFFVDLVNFALQKAEEGGKKGGKKGGRGGGGGGEGVRTAIQLIGQISQFSGHRLGEFMDKIIPLIGGVVREGQGREEGEGGEEEVELKEMCFQTYESLVERCPREVGGVVGELVELSLNYLVWDPNYTGGGGEEEEEEGWGDGGEEGWGDEGDEEWGYGSGESDDEFDYDVEDDDMSGKVSCCCNSYYCCC